MSTAGATFYQQLPTLGSMQTSVARFGERVLEVGSSCGRKITALIPERLLAQTGKVAALVLPLLPKVSLVLAATLVLAGGIYLAARYLKLNRQNQELRKNIAEARGSTQAAEAKLGLESQAKVEAQKALENARKDIGELPKKLEELQEALAKTRKANLQLSGKLREALGNCEKLTQERANLAEAMGHLRLERDEEKKKRLALLSQVRGADVVAGSLFEPILPLEGAPVSEAPTPSGKRVRSTSSPSILANEERAGGMGPKRNASEPGARPASASLVDTLNLDDLEDGPWTDFFGRS